MFLNCDVLLAKSLEMFYLLMPNFLVYNLFCYCFDGEYQ